MKLNAIEKNALEAVKYLLWQARVNVSSIGLEEELVMHPDFPSLASISDALQDWRVPSLATRITTDQLTQIPLPAIAYLDIRGGIMAPVKSVQGDTVEWLDTREGWQKEQIKAFSEKWHGTVLLIEPNENSGEINFKQNSGTQRHAGIRTTVLPLITAMCLIGFFFLHKGAIMATTASFQLLLITKLVGTLVTGFLLWQSIDTDNPFLQALCQLANKTNCNHILQSKAAKITGWLSWSEVGFVYFSGGFASLLAAPAAGSETQVYALLTITSFLALPYTGYAVWYQGFVARSWCTLCLMVVTILWIEVAISSQFFPESLPVFDAELLVLLFLAYAVPILIWWLFKPFIIRSLQVFDLRRELQKIKFNEVFVQGTFEHQRQIPPVFDGMKTCQLGSPAAKIILTVVTNPLCAPCAKLHHEIAKLVETQQDLRFRFIFIGPPAAQQIAERFLAAPEDQQPQVMNSWYENINQNRESWLANLPAGNNMSGEIHLHARWCQLANVTSTPTIFFNDHILPRAYQLKEVAKLEQIIQRASSVIGASN